MCAERHPHRYRHRHSNTPAHTNVSTSTRVHTTDTFLRSQICTHLHMHAHTQTHMHPQTHLQTRAPKTHSHKAHPHRHIGTLAHTEHTCTHKDPPSAQLCPGLSAGGGTANLGFPAATTVFLLELPGRQGALEALPSWPSAEWREGARVPPTLRPLKLGPLCSPTRKEAAAPGKHPATGVLQALIWRCRFVLR